MFALLSLVVGLVIGFVRGLSRGKLFPSPSTAGRVLQRQRLLA